VPIRLHTLLDLGSNIPSFIFISDGKLPEVNVLDQLVPEPSAFSVMDRGYLDIERLCRYNAAGSCFVIRAKSNLKAKRRYSQTADRHTGLICDQTVELTGYYSHKGFDRPLRRIRFKDPESGKTLVFLANNFVLLALTITRFYRLRSQIELFLKWIKQHLVSRRSSAPRRTRSKHKFGSRCPSTCSWPSSKSAVPSPPACKKSYKY